jgi:hypothetical protein
LQFIITNLNIFVFSGFVRNELSFIRDRNIISVTIDMPCMLARFDYSFNKNFFTNYLTRSQFGGFRKLFII